MASPGWLRRLVILNNIVFGWATSVGQKIPSDAPERCAAFLDFMNQNHNNEQYFNMDETPCYFDIPCSSSFDFKGVQSVTLKTTGHEKLPFTAALTAGVVKSGEGFQAVKLPPSLFWKHESHQKESFRRKFLYSVQKGVQCRQGRQSVL